jgi:hypothetical protein
LLARTEGMFIVNPELFQLHGIQFDELAKDGISVEELIYINCNFDAGSAYHKISGEKQVVLTSYRKNFIRNAKVRKAWKKYLRDKMFSPSPFVDAVDAYIMKVEKEAEQQSGANQF